MTFETLEQIYNETNQAKVQQLFNGRVYTKSEGWTNVNLTPKLREQIIKECLEFLGGREKTQNKLKIVLSRHDVQSWILDRLFVEKITDSFRIGYLTAQCYVSERAAGRKALLKMY